MNDNGIQGGTIAALIPCNGDVAWIVEAVNEPGENAGQLMDRIWKRGLYKTVKTIPLVSLKKKHHDVWDNYQLHLRAQVSSRM